MTTANHQEQPPERRDPREAHPGAEAFETEPQPPKEAESREAQEGYGWGV